MTPPPRANPPAAPIHGRPSWVSCGRQPDGLRIRFSSWSAVCLVPLAAGAVLLALAFGLSPRVALLPGVYPILACPVALPPAAWAVLRIISTTTIDATANAVMVTRAPAALPARLRIESARIVQCYIVTSRWGARVWVATDDGGRYAITPLLLLDRAGGAVFIERTLDRFLGLKDRPILCPQCGYDLVATRRRCPECGARFRKGRLA